MRIIPKANTLRKGILLYRGIRYRKGFGVHSPFVFNLITKVIEERCQYYSFYDIELIRKQLLFQDDEITLSRPPAKGGRCAAARSAGLSNAKRYGPSTAPYFSVLPTISNQNIRQKFIISAALMIAATASAFRTRKRSGRHQRSHLYGLKLF